MSQDIHPTAIIHPGARLGENVSIGPYSIIGGAVVIGDGCRIASAVLIDGETTLGKDNRVFHGAVIGNVCQDLKYHGERTFVRIGDGTTIREFVTVNSATGEGESTVVGSNVLLMAYVHIAHDCQVGPHVVMANLASLAGHVEIGEHANIGGMAGIHQFVRIGAHAFVGACSAVLQDIPPFVKVQGNRAKPFGLNVVGLRRHGISREALQALKEAYRVVFESELNTSQALEQLTIGGGAFPEVQRFVEFIQRSRRGISK